MIDIFEVFSLLKLVQVYNLKFFYHQRMFEQTNLKDQNYLKNGIINNEINIKMEY